MICQRGDRREDRVELEIAEQRSPSSTLRLTTGLLESRFSQSLGLDGIGHCERRIHPRLERVTVVVVQAEGEIALIDPGAGATFERVLETSRVVRDALDALEMPSLVKTTGSKGLHVYVPIVRGPQQKQVWTFAKALGQELARRHPALMTAEYRVANRPRGRVLVDYNQNAWGRTLASIYSVRPTPAATVSTPVTWKEIDRGVRIEDFTIKNVPPRIARLGDLWKPLLRVRGRFNLSKYV